MKSAYKDVRSQKTLSLTLCILISYQPITFFINTVFNLFVGEGFIYDTLVCYLCVLVFLLKSLAIITRSIKRDVLGVIALLLVAYLATYLFCPQNRSVMFTNLTDVMGNPLYVLFVFSVSGYIFARYIEDYGLLMKYVVNSSLIVVACSAITFAIMLNSHEQPQYMVFSYNMLLQVVALFIAFMEHRRYSTLITALLGFGLILFAGARGPLVCLLAALLVYVIFRKSPMKQKVLSITVLFLAICVITFFFRDILMSLKKICDDLGIGSRTIMLMIQGDFFNDSGRNLIQEKIISAFSIFGSGLYGDRYFGGGARGLYAHNFFIELLSQWGIVLGPILIIAVLALILGAILSKDKNSRDLSVIFISAGFFKLFFSGSYLAQEPAFWILLALGVNSIILRKRGKRNENTLALQHDVTESSSKYIKTSK